MSRTGLAEQRRVRSKGIQTCQVVEIPTCLYGIYCFNATQVPGESSRSDVVDLSFSRNQPVFKHLFKHACTRHTAYGILSRLEETSLNEVQDRKVGVKREKLPCSRQLQDFQLCRCQTHCWAFV